MNTSFGTAGPCLLRSTTPKRPIVGRIYYNTWIVRSSLIKNLAVFQ